jgi:hydroxymethylbilane synthase
VRARVVENSLFLKARVLSMDGARALAGEIAGSRDDAESLGTALGRELVGRGARELMTP